MEYDARSSLLPDETGRAASRSTDPGALRSPTTSTPGEPGSAARAAAGPLATGPAESARLPATSPRTGSAWATWATCRCELIHPIMRDRATQVKSSSPVRERLSS